MAPSPRIISRYEIVDRLGVGGMGALYLARDPNIDRLVALKLLHSHFGGEMRDRFAQEARAAGALSHPNIVTIHDYGEFEEALFIVMEYVRGETVAELIKRRAQLPLLMKLRWMEELCSGLAYAHRSRIIHRDIKPLNLMIDQHETLKILDFGIARFADAGLTQVNMQIGTPGYMSPEQIENQPLDHRSDVFSTGVVLYELLTYRPAFSADSTHAALNRTLHDEPIPLADLCHGLDPAIDEIVGRALKKERTQRFPDMLQMRSAIERVRARLEAGHVEPMMVSPAPGPRQPGRRTDRELLERRRAAELTRHLEAARRAFAANDYDLAAEACERALVIDPSHSEALALLEQIQASENMTAVRTLLHNTRVAIREGSLTDAEALLEQAAGVDSAVLQTLREAVGARRAEQRGDAQPFTGARAAIARARGCAEIGAFAAALRYVDEALALDPGNSEATALKEELKARSAPPPPTFVEPKAVATPPPDVHSGVRSRVRGLMIGGTIAIALLAAVAIGWYFRQPDTTPRDAGVGISPAAQPTAVAPVPTPAPTAVKVAKPVAVGGDIPEPQKWRDVAPIHPPSARAKGAYGTVMLEITIAPNGRVSDTRVVKSIPLLDEAAQEAARQWQYAPTLVDGSPVAVVMTVPVSFAREQAAARGERATPSGGEGRRDSAPTFDADAALRRAQASMARQEFASALEDFQAVLSRQPENAAAQEGIAQIAERRNRADRFVRQATALFSDGDYDGATTNANRALDAYPGHVEATALLKKVQTAKDAEQALKRKPGGRD